MKTPTEYFKSLKTIDKPYRNKPSMFDLFKGYAMLSIIISHTINGYGKDALFSGSHSLLKNLLFDFNELLTFGTVLIPLFFIISGWGIKPTDFKKLLSTQSKYLLKPFFITFLLSLPCSFVLQSILLGGISHGIQAVKEIVFCVITGQVVQISDGSTYLPGLYTFWFVFAIFWGTIVLNVIMKIIPSKYQFLIISILSFIAVTYGAFIPNPFAITSSFIAIFFMYFGHWLKKNKLINKKIPVIVWILILIHWAFHSLVAYVNINMCSLALGFMDLLLCSIVAYMFIRFTLFVDSRIQNKITDALHFLGRHSMWLLCIHTFEFWVIPWRFIMGHFSHHVFLDCLILCILRVIINIALLYIIIYFNKITSAKK